VEKAVVDAKVEAAQEKSPKRILALPALEHAKAAVLNSLTAVSEQRTYRHAIREFVEWYCSEPRPPMRPVTLGYSVPTSRLTSDK